MKVAIVDDWLTNFAGKERVTLALHKMFPEAPIYTSVFNSDGPGMEVFSGIDVRTSFIQKLPRAKTHHQLYPWLRPLAFSRFDLSDYDVVISSSGAEAKGVNTKPETLHISYIHSPTHYYWVRPDEYLSSDTMGFLGKVLRLGLRILIKPLRRWDYLAAQKPNVLIANSNTTNQRIQQFYDRESQIIFPPVDVERFTPPEDPPKRHGFVVLGRQVHYKRIDLAVKACTELGLLLRVIGRGPEHEKLRALAGHTIEFYEDLTDEEVAEALWHAEALIFPGVEDFGLTAAEALAAQCPVIAIRGGGALDIVTDKTGIFFDEQTTESLSAVLENFDSGQFKTEDFIKQSNKFSENNFREKIEAVVSLRK